ncbi:MAG: hypothetical protein KatS3mg040_0511 [Candidatus Kapaibacterium sp.]|nr:MAG: hypothetical protein KatS3mg040_0511 [Candidatus Kapabacteria bacterium]
MKLLLLLTTAWLLAFGRSEEIVTFALEDQWGTRWESSQLVGKPYVLILADRESAEHALQWGTELGRRLGNDVLVLGCANFAGVPFFLRWYVRARVRDRVTSAPLLLDWDGTLFERLRCNVGVPTVLAVGSDSRIFYRYEGLPEPDVIGHVVGKIRSYRAETLR